MFLVVLPALWARIGNDDCIKCWLEPRHLLKTLNTGTRIAKQLKKEKETLQEIEELFGDFPQAHFITINSLLPPLFLIF